MVDLVDGPYGNYGWYQLVSDTNGRFRFGGLPPGRAVKLTAFDGPGYGIWNQSGLSQVCAVHPTIHGDTTADIELVQAGVLPMTYGSPTLSGVVFEATAEGRRPASDMAVVYSSNSHDGADVYARTDAEGRYTFCGIPLGGGYLLPACTRAVMPIPGYRPTTFPVEIRGDTVLDAGCP